MVRKSVSTGRRGLGSLLAAGGLGVLVVATAAACASSPKAAGAGGTASVPVATSSSGGFGASAPASASASPTTGAGGAPSTSGAASSPSGHPVVPTAGGIVVNPQAQLTKAPAGSRLTVFDSATRSKDGMTLYLGLESQGGACGQYDVVLQQTSGKVEVGLVHLPSGGRVCPMYVAHTLIAAKLSAPLGGRAVMDLANGQVVTAPEVS